MEKGITYDAKSFVINGKREFLTSGSLHYFRVPRELWRDRLYQARHAGLNTIQTYVGWNFLGYREDEFDFSGRRDLKEFIQLCDEMGLWVVARPGPYICSEWDFGGLTPWLMNYNGIRLRTCDPVYLRFVERWFEQLIPIIAGRQVSRGGNVILVQIENELDLVQPADGALYMNYLRNLVRRLGIDVPLITCAGRAEGALECINAHKPADSIDALRLKQPGAPIHSTEFWPAWYTVWNQKEQSRRSPADVERETWRMLALGAAGYNYYMWHGGTNFGYSTMYLQRTSYDFDAQLSEVGGLTEKYHACRKVAYFAQALKDVLCEADEEHAAKYRVTADGAELHLRAAENGAVAFLDNPGDRRAEARLAIGDEALPPIPVEPGSIRPVVIGWKLEEGVRMAYSTACVFTMRKYGRERVLVLYGRKNEKVRLALELKSRPSQPEGSRAEWADGRLVLETKIPADAPEVETFGLGQKEFKLVFVNDAMLAKTFVTDNGIVVGAYFVRGRNNSLLLEYRGDEEAIFRVAPGPVSKKQKRSAEPKPLPRIKNWRWRQGGAETDPDFNDSDWIEMGLPTNRVFLRDYSGYGWYRAAVYCDKAQATTIYFKGIGDRAVVFVEGREVGTVEAPPENRASDPAATFNVRLAKGRNVISVLTENLGHVTGAWQLGRAMETERKGIFDDVTLGWDPSRKVIGWRFRGKLGGEVEGWTDGEGQWKRIPRKPESRFNWYHAEFELADEELAADDRPILLRMDGMTKGVIWVNGRNMGRFWMTGAQRDYYLPKPWLFRRNTLVIFEEGKAAPTDVSLVRDPIHAVMKIRKM